MTFEASRKKQTLVLQPRGKPLYEEKNSFGLKMLESMGWQKGNGLGKNQQGNKDFIQVRYKNNDFGLGFDGLKDNQWTQNETNFDSLLKELNNQTKSASNSDRDDSNKSKPTKSLEEQSKQSRARVHYKKFTRGKDVFKYSEKDLANIFGKKSLKDDDQAIEEVIKEEIEIEDKPETYKSDLIINTGVSIVEYFNKKKKETEETDQPPKKKHKRNQIDQLIIDDEETCKEKDIQSVESSKKEKKKKDKLIVEETVITEENKNEEIPHKKKKKKSKVIIQEQSVEEVEQLQPIEEVKSKKKRKKDVQEVEEVNEIQEVSQQCDDKDDRPKGTNAFYSNNVIQISSNIANKISHVNISVFNNSNIGDIVGYGMSEDIELKVVKTKIGEKFDSADKYALYNMDKLHTKQVNHRKIKTKLKKTKKSIAVI